MSDIRITAFGGTRYGPRAQSGSWGNIGTYSDVEGLAEDGAVSFGVALNGHRACLVLRQLQSVSERGGYAYTMLIDPGDHSWARANWNAAGVAAIVLSDSELTRLLLLEPERAATQAISQVIVDRIFQPWPPHALAEDSERRTILDAIVDTTRLGSSLVVHTARPSPEAVATALESLPMALRVGAGWLIGAAPTGLPPLTVNALFVDRAADGAPTAGIAERVTDILVRRLATIECDTPAHLWSTPFPDTLNQILSLDRAAGTTQFDEDAFQDALEGMDLGFGREEALGRSILNWRNVDRSPRWAEWTTAVLPYAVNGEATPPTARFEPAAVARYLDERGLTLAAGESAVLLPSVTPIEVWRHQITNASTASRVRDLTVLAAGHVATPTELGDLMGQAIARSRTLERDLSVWHHADLPLEGPLSISARAAVTAEPATVDDYLFLGADSRATWLAHHHADLVTTAVDRAIALVREGRDTKQLRVSGWLDALATSPVRETLPFELKVRLARIQRKGSWGHFRAIFEIDPVRARTPVPKDEQSRLLTEIEQRLALPGHSALPLPLPSSLSRLGTAGRDLVPRLCEAALQGGVDRIAATAADLRGLDASRFVQQAIAQCLANPDATTALTNVRRLASMPRQHGKEALSAMWKVIDGWKSVPTRPDLAEALMTSHLGLLSDVLEKSGAGEELIGALDAGSHDALVRLCADVMRDAEMPGAPRIRQFARLSASLERYYRRKAGIMGEVEQKAFTGWERVRRRLARVFVQRET